MSWLFSSAAPTDEPTLHPVTDRDGPKFGALTQKDLEWQVVTSGFVTETQVWYATTKDGALLSAQVIHSSVGLWYPQIQFTFRYHQPNGPNPRTIWKSISVTNLVVGPSGLDKRSIASDQFTITATSPDTYEIKGVYDNEVSISWTVTRLAEGWKFGEGPRGGFTYFGPLTDPAPGGEDPDTTSGGHGYVVHRFWPRISFTGVTKIGFDNIEMDGSRGVFIHAIQGMRPNLVAARWNFSDFQSLGEDGTSLIQMEFTTTDDYERKTISVGSIVVGDKLVAVTGGKGEEANVCTHEDHQNDEETGYNAPGKISWTWKDEKANASLVLPLLEGESAPGQYQPKGLIEKVDVLAEVPYFIKKAVAYAAGTQPYIYQYLNPVEASVTTNGETKTVKGLLFNEATFISE